MPSVRLTAATFCSAADGSPLCLLRRHFPCQGEFPEGKANRFKIVGEGLRAHPIFCNVSRQGVGTLPYIGVQNGVYNWVRGLPLPKFRIPNSELHTYP